MGTWGMAVFDNDDAMDWLAELEQSTDDTAVRAALETAAATGADAYLEAPEGQLALAAAEVVAAAAGTRGDPLPEEAETWIGAYGASAAPHTALAARAVHRVLASENSEVRELWSEEGGAEADDIAVWEEKVEDLRRRLRSVG